MLRDEGFRRSLERRAAEGNLDSRATVCFESRRILLAVTKERLLTGVHQTEVTQTGITSAEEIRCG
jgi:hypothetical protein